MALFTGKGDDGTTKTFDMKPGVRMSKASSIAEALGSLDEVNSYLGQCKILAEDIDSPIGSKGHTLAYIVHDLQEKLFIVQAELAGAEKSIVASIVDDMSVLIGEIEVALPPITSFFISGGTELAAKFDFARTLSRRAERRVVLVREVGDKTLDPNTYAFLNRLSSVLYALARLANHIYGIEEKAPDYQ